MSQCSGHNCTKEGTITVRVLSGGEHVVMCDECASKCMAPAESQCKSSGCRNPHSVIWEHPKDGEKSERCEACAERLSGRFHIDDLRKDLGILEEERDGAQAALRKTTGEIQTLQRTLELNRQERVALSNENEELRDNIQAQIDENFGLQEEREEAHASEKQIAELQEELKKSREERDKKKSEYDHFMEMPEHHLQANLAGSQGLNKELRSELDELREDYESSCKLVADMHQAAMGEVRGPVRGVVEDVEHLRIERDNLICERDGFEADLATITETRDDVVEAAKKLTVEKLDSMVQIQDLAEKYVDAIAQSIPAVRESRKGPEHIGACVKQEILRMERRHEAAIELLSGIERVAGAWKGLGFG